MPPIPMIKLNTEQELLVHCARMQCNTAADAPAALEVLLHKGIHWNNFLTLTTQNRVTPLVYKSLQGLPSGGVPPEVLHQLSMVSKQIAVQNMHQLIRLKGLLRLFEQANIRAIPFKGAALARLYPNLGLREWTDIDVIVPREAVYTGQRILFDQGFVPDRQPGNHQLEDHPILLIRCWPFASTTA